MLTERFTWWIVLRVVMLTVAIGVLAWIWGDERLFFTQVILVLCIIGITVELVRFVNTSNREIARFLFALRHSDLSVTFKQPSLGSSFLFLHQQMTELADTYKHVKIEKEAQYRLLQALVDHLSVGIILLAEENIILINATAQRLLNVGTSHDWKMILQCNPSLASELDTLGDHGRKLIETPSREGARMVSIDVMTTLVLGRSSKLITLQDINAEIEQKELEAWHKLIRILTHEIMNSITPIASLTETLQGMLTNGDGTRKSPEQLTGETIDDMRFSLTTIHGRSEGLLQFVENYRKLTRVPKPRPVPVDMARFIASIQRLMEDAAQRNGVSLTFGPGPERPRVSFDPSLMEQVLINLITNAMHATEGLPLRNITLHSFIRETTVIFEVRDTGKGIPQHLLREIFVPFYSTRPDGSGIGLSLSRQIVASHGGTLTVASTPDEGTVFTVSIPRKTE